MSPRSWCCGFAAVAATACTSPALVWGPSLQMPWDRPGYAATTSLRAPFNEAEFSLRGRLHEALAEIETAMQPVCAPHCGRVELIGLDHFGRVFATIQSAPGRMSSIYYDPLLVWPRNEADRPLLGYAVAHEYGHHLDITMQNGPTGDRWAAELRADALAGCALVRANIDPAPVFAVMQYSSPDAGSAEAARELTEGSDEWHPAFRWSMRALVAGAQACNTGRFPLVAELVLLGQRIADEAHDCAKTSRCR